MAFRIGAQRASRTSMSRHLAWITALGLLVSVGAGVTHPPVATAATGPKVAIIVGPAGWQTAGNRNWANAAAQEALRYTPNVVKVYSPQATWGRVRTAISGASIVVYIGAGYGSPAPSSRRVKATLQDGFGLNPSGGRDNARTQFYGEASIRTVRLAPNAVVVLTKASYASGSSEPGLAPPTLSIARSRVDNYGSGFLAAGAAAVIS